MRVRYSTHHAREPLLLQRGTNASNTYLYYASIDKLRHHICIYVIVSSNRIENNAVYIFLRCQTESKTIVKESILQNFCSQELQDGTGMDYACSSWKLLHIRVGCPFLLMDLYLILHYYSCTATTLYCHF